MNRRSSGYGKDGSLHDRVPPSQNETMALKNTLNKSVSENVQLFVICITCTIVDEFLS